DEPAQRGAMLAGNLLPGGLAHHVAEADAAVGYRLGEENSPTVFRHLGRAVGRPTLGIDRGRGAEIDVGAVKGRRAKLAPPIEKMRLPMLERALQGRII